MIPISWHLFFIVGLTLLWSGCAELPEPSKKDNQPTRRCVPGEGATGAPKTIAQAVDLINTLPRPVTVACFVESLDRPLAIHATNSIFSAQPAAGDHNPRIFIFSDKLIMSIVPDGNGAPLLEFGQLLEGEMSIKAELKFPIDHHVPQSEPYAHLPFNDNITTCGFVINARTPSRGGISLVRPSPWHCAHLIANRSIWWMCKNNTSCVLIKKTNNPVAKCIGHSSLLAMWSMVIFQATSLPSFVSHSTRACLAR